jgi:hypothetical protein
VAARQPPPVAVAGGAWCVRHEPRRKIEAQTIFNFGAHIASMLLEEMLPEAAPLDGGWPYLREVLPHALGLTFPSRPASLGA